jgi:uncharacterized protein
MDMTALKIVIDTNILLAIIGRKSPFRWLFDGVINGQLRLCISNEILMEYREILARKTTVEIAENIAQFLLLSPYVEKTEVFYRFQLITQDADDNKFVDCAIAANAVCLVSNDNHLQILKTISFPHVEILTISEFETAYRRTLGL